jgi:hypothetical protein
VKGETVRGHDLQHALQPAIEQLLIRTAAGPRLDEEDTSQPAPRRACAWRREGIASSGMQLAGHAAIGRPCGHE